MKYLIMSDGISPHTLKWIEKLNKNLELYLLSFSGVSDEINGIMDNDKIATLNINISSKGGNYSILSHISKIKDIVHRIKPDILNAHYITSYGFLGAILKKFYFKNLKLISSCWGSDILVTPDKNYLYYKLTQFSLNQADLITSDSYHMTDKVKKIIRHDIPCITFPFGVKEIVNISASDKDYNLFFSNRLLSENYRIDKVISIFHQITKDNKYAKLIIANKGDLEDKLKSMVKDLGLNNVEFVGYLDSAKQNEYYKNAGFFFSVPSSDAASVSLMEAMSYGCIPIVSNIPANREWIISRYNGLYEEDIDYFGKINYKKDSIFDINRQIIDKKAVWNDNIEFFLNKISEFSGVK